MTPARQPHPHEKCHECHVFFKCEQLPPCAPHTSAPAPVGYTGEDVFGPFIHGHNAQVAKAAREKMLETLEGLRKWSNGEYNEAYLSDNEREMRIHNDYGCKIWEVMGSLRTQQEAEQPKEGRR